MLTNWGVGKDNRHGLDETEKQSDHHLKLTQSGIIIMKACKKQNMFTGEQILRGKPPDFDVV